MSESSFWKYNQIILKKGIIHAVGRKIQHKCGQKVDVSHQPRLAQAKVPEENVIQKNQNKSQ